MPIEVSCNNCQAVLRVADEHAGKSARCPQCSNIVAIPSSSANAGTFDHPPGEGAPGSSAANPYGAGNLEPTVNQGTNPYTAPTQHGPRAGVQEHRGTTILVLGIVSLVCCVIAGIPAIIMANEDLRKMDQGIMDSTGRSVTNVGKILGIVGLVLAALGIVLQLLLFGLGVAAGI